MCSVPDGYGSISSWYQWFAGSSPGGGLGVWKVCSSSQTRCHFASICSGSYLSIWGLETKKPLVREAVGSWRGVATFAPWTTREAAPSTKMLATSMGVFGIDHIAFRTPDPARLREFYAELLGAERLEGAHAPLRVGGTTLVFFEEVAAVGADELAFEADLEGFSRALEAARRLGALEREPVEHTPWSRGFLVHDPDGRRIEVVRKDEGVYWKED